MSHRNYEVLVDGHTHAGRELAKGEIVSLRPVVAERYKEVFKESSDKGEPKKSASTAG